MHRPQIAWIAVAAVLMLALPGGLFAQGVGGPGGYYGGHGDNPNGPTVSPYLNLLQTNQFGISNYHTLVKPLEEQRQDILQQGADLQRLQRDFKQAPRSGGAASIRGTGLTTHVNRYLNYSHYYNFNRTR